jgi:hypothetical protein
MDSLFHLSSTRLKRANNQASMSGEIYNSAGLTPQFRYELFQLIVKAAQCHNDPKAAMPINIETLVASTLEDV